MQYIAAMLKVRQAFFEAILNSLLRTKSLLQTILNVWISPTFLKGHGPVFSPGADAPKKTLLDYKAFLSDVEDEFRSKDLAALSKSMKAQIADCLQDHPMCMLPSYNHQLPTGEERGTYLALDVGGSTFRVALIELPGRASGQESKVVKNTSFKINAPVRQLKGVEFFDWMADHIKETLGDAASTEPLSMGLAWSFPIEQTSLHSGRLLDMGKGFQAANGLIGQDLGDLIQSSCARKGLHVSLNAIVNDSSATLLSKAYADPSTRYALILGTGFNAAVHLPVSIFGSAKFGVRPASWHEEAENVIVNTELSMFGKGILPMTRWDTDLRADHAKPDFQPLEHFVSGGYLGEITRLVLVEGIQTAGLFGGVVPSNLKERYSLDTETISRMELDATSDLTAATELFSSRHPTTVPYTLADIQSVRLVASYVSQRASGLIAASIHALWELRNETQPTSSTTCPQIVAYNGSVLESYPLFRASCQAHLDTLVQGSGGAQGDMELVYAEESSLLGAAVAVACLDS